MKYKAIIFDIDNTLLSNDSMENPSENIRKAVEKAQKRGIHVGVATARSLQKVAYIFDYLHLTGPSILSDGAQIIDAQKRTFFEEWPMSENDVMTLVNLLRKKKMDFWIQDNGEDHPFPGSYKPFKPFVIVIHGIRNKKDADSFIHLLPSVPDLSINLSSSTKVGKVDVLIKHNRATKAHAVLDLAKILAIKTEEIIGVGDGYNDFPLLSAVGLKVAMGNAVTDLKEIADYIAPGIKGEGLVEVFNRFLLS